MSRITSYGKRLIALSSICLGLAFSAASVRAQGLQAGTLNTDADPTTGVLTLTWTGTVATPMASQIESAFRHTRDRVKRVILKLASGGGSVNEGERVIEVLQQIRQTHQLDTAVEQGRTCGSMCVFIYLQGQQRYAALSSLWLFHEVSHSDPETRRIVRLDRDAWEHLVERYFPAAGVSKAWTEQMKPKTIRSDYWQTGADLLRDRSGVAHFGLTNQKDRLISERGLPKPEHIVELHPRHRPGQPEAQPRIESQPRTEAQPRPDSQPQPEARPRVDNPRPEARPRVETPQPEARPEARPEERRRVAEPQKPRQAESPQGPIIAMGCRRLNSGSGVYENVPCGSAMSE